MWGFYKNTLYVVYFSLPVAKGQEKEQAHAFLATLCQTAYPGWQLTKTPAGRPYLYRGREEAFVTLSHTRQGFCCLVSDRPVGADLEWKRPAPIRILERVSTSREQTWFFRQAQKGPQQKEKAFFTLWTGKEALYKEQLFPKRHLFQLDTRDPKNLERLRTFQTPYHWGSLCTKEPFTIAIVEGDWADEQL